MEKCIPIAIWKLSTMHNYQFMGQHVHCQGCCTNGLRPGPGCGQPIWGRPRHLPLLQGPQGHPGPLVHLLPPRPLLTHRLTSPSRPWRQCPPWRQALHPRAPPRSPPLVCQRRRRGTPSQNSSRGTGGAGRGGVLLQQRRAPDPHPVPELQQGVCPPGVPRPWEWTISCTIGGPRECWQGVSGPGEPTGAIPAGQPLGGSSTSLRTRPKVEPPPQDGHGPPAARDPPASAGGVGAAPVGGGVAAGATRVSTGLAPGGLGGLHVHLRAHRRSPAPPCHVSRRSDCHSDRCSDLCPSTICHPGACHQGGPGACRHPPSVSASSPSPHPASARAPAEARVVPSNPGHWTVGVWGRGCGHPLLLCIYPPLFVYSLCWTPAISTLPKKIDLLKVNLPGFDFARLQN
ncbi:uncharacterized protein LOC142002560 [Carettochelys insculpta]|uniref:uncharacterized protein LOC142002560 n=1 Tax=Carettochelys insculpta TaxID=44489 RepID=UPI003EBDDEF4